MTPADGLALARLPGVGRRRLRTMLAAAARPFTDSAEFAEFAERESRRQRFAAPTSSEAARAWEEGRRLAEACHRRGWGVLVRGANDYPEPFRRLTDPPALVFVQGGPLDLQPPRIAIIGTREPSPWGALTARECALAATRAGAIVVAGLAWGIDTEAHAEVVAHRGLTWAMLPGALDIIYPDANALLAQRIVEQGGVLVSEYLPGTRAQPTFFIERDRLQAALADAVIVVETSLTGGTMHTVRYARELNVPLRVTLPADARHEQSAGAEVPDVQQGTRQLQREGVAIVSPQEIGALAASIRLARGVPGPAADPQGRLFP